MKTETYIRFTEFGVAAASTYMVSVTMLQTSLYAKFQPFLNSILGFFLPALGAEVEYLDMLILLILMGLSVNFWRGGKETDYGKLFALNMLLYFPSVLDFSLFNWVNLILPYEIKPKVTAIWVFGVGLLLQITYLTLRYTAIFKEVRVELEERGAETHDLDKVSNGQMGYLLLLVLSTAVISTTVYIGFPIIRNYISDELTSYPYPHLIIGILGSMLIAGATILYLRGDGTKKPVSTTSSSLEN